MTVCVTCGARCVDVQRISVKRRDGRVVRGVRAEVCTACGEQFFDSAAVEKILGAKTR